MPAESQTKAVALPGKLLLKTHEAAKYLGLRTDMIYKKAR